MTKEEVSVVHLTSAHSRYDTRIFLKECRSLANHGYTTYLVVADGLSDEEKDGVRIKAVRKGNGRLQRMIKTSYDTYKRALSLNADIYHLHDPELLPYAWALTLRGKKVIFDAHEDFPKQLRSKHYLNFIFRVLLSAFFSWFEMHVCRKLSGVLAATPTITEKFKQIGPNVETINNYPLAGELASGDVDWNDKEPWVAYVGGISAIRGISEVVKALEYVPKDIRLKLAGIFNDGYLKEKCKKEEGWVNVDELGHIGRVEVKKTLNKCIGGLVTFLPEPNHIDAQPNKMFEYMSAGVPVIGSNFPLWRQVIENNRCGICVDPLQPKEIAQAIIFLHENPEEAQEMGLNGQRAVEEKYCWAREEEKLINFYRGLH